MSVALRRACPACGGARAELLYAQRFARIEGVSILDGYYAASKYDNAGEIVRAAQSPSLMRVGSPATLAGHAITEAPAVSERRRVARARRRPGP